MQKMKLTKKHSEIQGAIIGTIWVKSNNQHWNSVNQATFSLTSWQPLWKFLKREVRSFTRRVTTIYPATIFFTTARNITSHSNKPPKIGAMYQYGKYKMWGIHCMIFPNKISERFGLNIFFLRYMQYRFP